MATVAGGEQVRRVHRVAEQLDATASAFARPRGRRMTRSTGCVPLKEKTEMKTTAITAITAFLSLAPSAARAHCDTLDGPVVKTAQTALETKDVAPVLAWVKPAGEAEIRAAFHEAVNARAASPASREASDRKFFETLVRVHRAGEGAEYTGLKPAGAGATPGLEAADAGIAKRDAAAVERLLAEAARSGVRQRFAALNALQPPGKDVAAGRRWVEAYVEYVHYVERAEAALASGGAHHAEGHSAKADDHAAKAASARTAAKQAAHPHGH
jgi:hypothetical protein